MEIMSGSCRLGFWFVHVWWSGDMVHRVIFSKTGIPGEAPGIFKKYCAGHIVSFEPFKSVATEYQSLYGSIYREVAKVPFGTTATYGEIGERLGTSPRVIGQAMSRNPTPLIVPCHRIVAKCGPGGFSPDPEIKDILLLMEKKALNKRSNDSGRKDRPGGMAS